MPRAAAIYCRISDDREGRHLGVDRQLADCHALAERKGWPVRDEYVDNDVSAYSGKLRPQYRRMLHDIKAGDVDAVIVWHVDRLHRQPKELEEFIETCDAAGLRDLATVTGDVDLATHDGQFVARIMGAVARKESDDKSRRILRKHQELAERGEVSGGGTRPYGFAEDRRTIKKSEAKIIREVVTRVLAGDSLRSVCQSLNDRSIPTSTGNAWSPSTLKRMLVSARISGQREHQGEIMGPAVWEPIIPPEQTARLRAFLGRGRGTTRTPRRYLLTGLLRCGRCGATLVSRPRADGERRYVCATGPGFAGCGGTAILARELDPFVADAVLHRLDTPELEAALRGEAAKDAEAAVIQHDLDDALDQADELAQAYGAKQISMREWLAARGPIDQRIEELRKALSRATRTTTIAQYVGQTATLRREWDSLDLSRQQAIVAAVLDHVVVNPARRGLNRFDESRLDAVWKP